MYLKAGFLLGSELSKNVRSAISVAQALGCGIEFDFNGASVLVWGGSDPDKVVADVKEQLKRLAALGGE